MKKTNLIILFTVLIGGAAYLGYLSKLGDTVEAAPPSPTSSTAPASSSTPASTPASTVASNLPDFTLDDINGDAKSIHELAGNKPTVFIYFNSTCHLCQDELASISKRIDEFKDYNVILTTVEPIEEMLGLVVRLGIRDKDFVHFLLDAKMEVATFYQIRSVPSIFLYDAKKQLVGDYAGITEVDLLLEKLSQGN
ncbi:TlpA family protein disulfide reductase [Algoriphagus antarcticus]|uniref:AhpC/TSA family protein n=1 Tax=Algoriphagus antarcticus TaxID=238540 RepID=A0A3E0DQZ0_9BACT|nr:redoxin domain-containing protein [Algoriphagus antarcticus]REG85424.1 AhpC/TSA family protein [Algoriphagus antarcticus]